MRKEKGVLVSTCFVVQRIQLVSMCWDAVDCRRSQYHTYNISHIKNKLSRAEQVVSYKMLLPMEALHSLMPSETVDLASSAPDSRGFT